MQNTGHRCMPSTIPSEQFSSFVDSSRRLLDTCGGTSTDLFAAIKTVFSGYMALHGNTSFMGVYLLSKGVLVLGPYIGPATIHDIIPIGVGVVGRTAAAGISLLISDVSTCDYYLSCCADVKSEITLPVRSSTNDVVGVLDLDSNSLKAYIGADQSQLEEVAELIKHACTKLAARLQFNPSW